MRFLILEEKISTCNQGKKIVLHVTIYHKIVVCCTQLFVLSVFHSQSHLVLYPSLATGIYDGRCFPLSSRTHSHMYASLMYTKGMEVNQHLCVREGKKIWSRHFSICIIRSCQSHNYCARKKNYLKSIQKRYIFK